jgi:hypothetical protein
MRFVTSFSLTKASVSKDNNLVVVVIVSAHDLAEGASGTEPAKFDQRDLRASSTSPLYCLVKILNQSIIISVLLSKYFLFINQCSFIKLFHNINVIK